MRRACARFFASSRRLAESRATPARTTPGSIHEGGELGYVLTHAFGAAFDNPDLIVAAVVGDGEAETGPLEGVVERHQLSQPRRDGAVLPILHLNGYKIAGPTVLGRSSDADIAQSARRSRLQGAFRRGRRADGCPRGPRAHTGRVSRPRFARSRTKRAHAGRRERSAALAGHRAAYAQGLDRPARGRRSAGRGDVPRAPGASYRACAPTPSTARTRTLAAQLPARGAVRRARRAHTRRSLWLAPRGERRMSANPHANGGQALLAADVAGLSRRTRCAVTRPASGRHESTRQLGLLLRDIVSRQPAQLSACSVPTRPTPTDWARCSRSRSRCLVAPPHAERRSRVGATAA